MEQLKHECGIAMIRLLKPLEYYQKKYDQENVAHILKSLVYFNDVDLTDWPVLIENPKLKWGDVKKRIEKAVMDYANYY